MNCCWQVERIINQWSRTDRTWKSVTNRSYAIGHKSFTMLRCGYDQAPNRTTPHTGQHIHLDRWFIDSPKWNIKLSSITMSLRHYCQNILLFLLFKNLDFFHLKGTNSGRFTTISWHHSKSKAYITKWNINGEDLEYVTQFFYLGSVKSSSGGTTEDVQSRITKAQYSFGTWNEVWSSQYELKDSYLYETFSSRKVRCLN